MGVVYDSLNGDIQCATILGCAFANEILFLRLKYVIQENKMRDIVSTTILSACMAVVVLLALSIPFVLAPMVFIWAINTLFGMSITYGPFQVLAVLVLLFFMCTRFRVIQRR